MITSIVRQLRPAIAVLFVLTVITGILYPLAVTAVAQVAFPGQANGSFITVNGRSSVRRSSARRSRRRSTCGAGRPRRAPATTPRHHRAPTWRPPARSSSSA